MREKETHKKLILERSDLEVRFSSLELPASTWLPESLKLLGY